MIDKTDKSARAFTLVGILLALFLGALDQTIVATALPRIVADLNGLGRYAWVRLRICSPPPSSCRSTGSWPTT